MERKPTLMNQELIMYKRLFGRIKGGKDMDKERMDKPKNYKRSLPDF